LYGDGRCVSNGGLAAFPPLKTLSNTNLPIPGSSFVGRERQLAEVASPLRDGGGRLVANGAAAFGRIELMTVVILAAAGSRLSCAAL
jgi:hypothetical protein